MIRNNRYTVRRLFVSFLRDRVLCSYKKPLIITIKILTNIYKSNFRKEVCTVLQNLLLHRLPLFNFIEKRFSRPRKKNGTDIDNLGKMAACFKTRLNIDFLFYSQS